jgi:hypothetical protein
MNVSLTHGISLVGKKTKDAIAVGNVAGRVNQSDGYPNGRVPGRTQREQVCWTANRKSNLSRAIGYIPMKAADGKIPLSMVQVKRKPQYLVFTAHFSALPSNFGSFACGKPIKAAKLPDFSSLLPRKWCRRPGPA